MAAEGVAEDRVAFANRMRLLLSPKDSVNPDGSLRQEFFKPKKVVFVIDKKWGDAERDKLYEGLETYGVGAWKDIRSNLLPAWDETALRIKASRLIGSQNLSARYAGWKGTRAAVELEYGRNKRIGERTGCWKSGVLVEDNHGSVAKALAEEAASGEGGGPSAAAAAAAGEHAAAAPAAKKARGARS